MTPKEKAKEKAEYLLKRFYFFNDYQAKQSALIAVNEILDNFGSMTDDKQHYCAYSTIKFYQEVKQEIEKL